MKKTKTTPSVFSNFEHRFTSFVKKIEVIGVFLWINGSFHIFLPTK